MSNPKTTTTKATLEIHSLQFKLICFILEKKSIIEWKFGSQVHNPKNDYLLILFFI